MGELEKHLNVKLKTKDVAQAFEVEPVTVSSWVKQARLKGMMPRKARRLGRTFTLEEVLLFARAADDGGASEEQLRRWWEEHEERILSGQSTGVNSTDVLRSSA